MLKTLKEIQESLERIENSVCEGKEGLSDLEKQYSEYKFFADARGMKLLSERGLVDEFNHFMDECEATLFGDERELVLPQPSPKLKAFKDRFKKFF